MFIEKLNVKVLLLNNQHLGMVVQWEDRFYKVRSRWCAGGASREGGGAGAGSGAVEGAEDWELWGRGMGVGCKRRGSGLA